MTLCLIVTVFSKRIIAKKRMKPLYTPRNTLPCKPHHFSVRRITFIFPFNHFHAAQSYPLPAPPPCFNLFLQINTCNSRDGSSRLLSDLLHRLSTRGRQMDPLQHRCSEGNVVPLSRCRSSRYQPRRSANHSYQCTHAPDCVYNSRRCRRRGNRPPL